jgi:hypothetical protein
MGAGAPDSSAAPRSRPAGTIGTWVTSDGDQRRLRDLRWAGWASENVAATGGRLHSLPGAPDHHPAATRSARYAGFTSPLLGWRLAKGSIPQRPTVSTATRPVRPAPTQGGETFD